MKKNICSLIIMFIITAMFIITGCSPKALTDNPETSAQVVSNGGMTVIKGDYLYYVNGVVSDVSSLDPRYDNKQGKVNHSAIYRTKLSDGQIVKDDEGFLEKSELVVSKVVGFKNGGFYIIDDYIYYATPNMNLDKSGKAQTSRVVFHRVNINGTKDTEICGTPVAEDNLDWTCYKVGDKVYIVAYLSSTQTIMIIDTTTNKVAKEITGVTSYAFYDEKNYATNNDRSSNALKYIYFTRNSTSDDNLPANYNGNIIARFNITTCEEERLQTDSNSTYAIKDISLNHIYYTRSVARGSQSGSALLYKQNLSSWNYANEIKMSNVVYSTYYICDFGNDLFIGVSDSATFKVQKDGANNIITEKISSSGKTILGIHGGFAYFAIENAIYKFNILDGVVTNDEIDYELCSDDAITMITDHANYIDFDNQRLYVCAEYTSAHDDSQNYYLNFVEPNTLDNKFVGVFQDNHLPEPLEDVDIDGDGEVDSMPHVK